MSASPEPGFVFHGRYLVPLRVAVRRAEGIEVGQELVAALELASRS